MLHLHHVHCLFVSVKAEESKSEEAKTDDAKAEEAKPEESEPKTEQTESNGEQKPGSELFKLQGVKKTNPLTPPLPPQKIFNLLLTSI